MPAESAYVDTSVLGAYYCAEPLSDAAEAALARTGAPLRLSSRDATQADVFS